MFEEVELHDIRSVAKVEWKILSEGLDANLLIEFYRSQDTAIGFIRAAQLERSSKGIFNLEIENNLHSARLYSENRLEQLLITAIYAFFQSTKMYNDGNNPNSITIYNSENLELLLNEACTISDRSIFRLEVQFRLMLALCHLCEFRNDNTQAHRWAREMLILAHQMNAVSCELVAQLRMANILNQMGRLNDSLELHCQLIDHPFSLPLNLEASQYQTGILYANLGDKESSLKHLDTSNFRIDKYSEMRDFVLALYGELNYEDIDSTVEASLIDLHWLIKGFRLLIKASTLEPTRAADVTRQKIYDSIRQDTLPQSAQPTTIDEILARWIQAYALFQRGQFSLAGNLLNIKEEIPDQELMLRALILGLKIELFMLPGNFGIEEIFTTLQEAKKWLEFSISLSRASVVGLHKLVWRWCPNAACFLYITMDYNRNLNYIMDSVISLKDGCRVYDFYLPPAYAYELVLKEFGILQQVGAAPLNGRMITQRNQLLCKYGDVSFWRPVVLPHKLVFGLLKTADKLGDTYRNRAQAVANDFGLTMYTTSKYGQEEMQRLEKMFQNWLTSQGNENHFIEDLKLLTRYI